MTPPLSYARSSPSMKMRCSGPAADGTSTASSLNKYLPCACAAEPQMPTTGRQKVEPLSGKFATRDGGDTTQDNASMQEGTQCPC